VGIVAASGTAILEVVCLLAREGVGITQAIAVHGQDLCQETGGTQMLVGLQKLQDDPATEIIILVSGKPARGAAKRVLTQVRDSDKPTVICFMGTDQHLAWRAGGIPAARLDEAAMRAAAWVRGWDQALISSRLEDLDEQLTAQAHDLQARVGPERRQVRGVFSGGVFCHQAQLMLKDVGSEAVEATFFDLSNETSTADFTSLLKEALCDPKVGIVVMDVVLSKEEIPKPDTVLAGTTHQALVVAHVCGTGDDPEQLADYEARLRKEGVIVAPSNAAAARLAGMVLGGLDQPRTAVP
jgi:FdrA protein